MIICVLVSFYKKATPSVFEEPTPDVAPLGLSHIVWKNNIQRLLGLSDLLTSYKRGQIKLHWVDYLSASLSYLSCKHYKPLLLPAS